jgi:hypothetical protein
VEGERGGMWVWAIKSTEGLGGGGVGKAAAAALELHMQAWTGFSKIKKNKRGGEKYCFGTAEQRNFGSVSKAELRKRNGRSLEDH